MQSKGENVENWNWKAYDRKQGIMPKEEAEAKDNEYDLATELQKAEEEVKRERAQKVLS